MISSYGDQSTTRNNPSYYRASPTLPHCSECFQRHLCSTCTSNIRVTQKWCYTYFLHESDPRRDHQQIVLLFILSLHALALHLAVKILLKSFCMKIWARWPYIHLSVVFPSRMPAGPPCYATNTTSENIPNIWHKSSTKHKEVRPDWNDKTIMQTTRLVYMEGFTNGSGCHF